MIAMRKSFCGIASRFFPIHNSHCLQILHAQPTQQRQGLIDRGLRRAYDFVGFGTGAGSIPANSSSLSRESLKTTPQSLYARYGTTNEWAKIMNMLFSLCGSNFERDFSDDLLQQIRDLPGTRDYFDYATRVFSLGKWKRSLQKGHEHTSS